MPISNYAKSFWIVAAIAGLLVWTATAGVGDMRGFEGLVLGVITTVLLGALLVWLNKGEGSENTGQAALSFDMIVPEGASPVWVAAVIAGLLVWIATAGIGDMGGIAGLLLGLITTGLLGALMGWLSEGETQPTPLPAEASRDVVSRNPAASVSAEVAAVLSVDDLKEIKGIGPKLEESLQAEGVTRFDQIAAWTDSDVERFAGLIGRTASRVRSEDWIGQARALAAKRVQV